MTILYRFFDRSASLLYVGITDDFSSRMEQHWSSKPWAGQVAEIQATEYPTRQQAAQVEREAIWAERPRHNVVHANGRTMMRSIRVPDALWAESVRKSKAEGTTVTAIVRDELRAYVGGTPC